jgi:transposase-like protein
MIWLTECVVCHNFVYILADGRVKCSVCHKKISLEKINKIITLIQAYVDDESALHLAKRLHLSYASVQQYYEDFRRVSAKICEDEYEQRRNKKCEYEEYFYLENSKKLKREAVFDAHNFLTFDYEGHIYTLLMPSLQQYKSQFLEDSVEDAYVDEFKKFKRESKIIKVSKYFNNIVQFWDYVEAATRKYKGINNEMFIYFLKEFEFKYNHSKDEAIELLINEYFKGKK